MRGRKKRKGQCDRQKEGGEQGDRERNKIAAREKKAKKQINKTETLSTQQQPRPRDRDTRRSRRLKLSVNNTGGLRKS